MTTTLSELGFLLFVLTICLSAGTSLADQSNGEGKPAYIVLDPNAPRPATAEGEPVPESKKIPHVPQRTWSVPSVRLTKTTDGEAIELANSAIKVSLAIDSSRAVRITSILTGKGREILSAPVSPFLIVDQDSTVLKDAAHFTVESWMPRQHSIYTEIEIRLNAPETVLWCIRLYRDKPHLEQRFGVPSEWRTRGNALTQVLSTQASLRPVMPNNSFARGFSNGRPNLKGRHRFEFVAQSDHLCYDPVSESGMAVFVAGIGGEERVLEGNTVLLDHVVAPFDAGEPVAMFLLLPFDGTVETGFMRLRRFIGREYACQRGKHTTFSWNQFWLWQGGIEPARSEVVTAERLCDILPHIADLGCEEFHLDAGWEVVPGDWRFDPVRFPEGFEPIRQFLRERGMRYHTWMNTEASDDPNVVTALIEETDLCKLFQDRRVDEKTLAGVRKVRERYPDFETFVHNCTSRSTYYRWGNPHFLSDLNQVYFGEGEYWAWSNVLPEKPEGDVNTRFFSRHSLRAGDLVTRSAAYQVHWAWPYTCIVPPHCGWAWFEDRELSELASRMFTTIAARADYQWGEDPRLLRPEVVEFFLDWTAFFKAARPYLMEYQHVLAPPDGIHPDGAAHLLNGEGFIVLCNPGDKNADVSLKQLLWEPELELHPEEPVRLTDWTKPLAPSNVQYVNLARPRGAISMKPLSYRVLGINVDADAMLAEVKSQRESLRAP